MTQRYTLNPNGVIFDTSDNSPFCTIHYFTGKRVAEAERLVELLNGDDHQPYVWEPGQRDEYEEHNREEMS